MYLYTIIAFALLFWQGEQPSRWIPLASHDVAWTLTLVLSQPFLVALTAWIVLRRWRGLIAAHTSSAERGQRFYHRASFVIRCGILGGFAATIFSSRWTDWFALGRITPVLQIVGDVIILTPFVVNLLVLWIITYPAETMVRSVTPVDSPPIDGTDVSAWRFRSYLGFHIRHYVLVVGAPLTLILFAADLTRSYGATIVSWTGWMWTPDAMLASVAFVVFLAAPVLLCRIWRTSPLAPGVVRDRLEQCATRIGLRFREILVWKTDGIMINAATMGLLARVRYVLLSDALLDTMDTDQVEAVFGHEAGHVRHHHIQYFLAFAIVGWVLVAALMEVLAYLSTCLGLPPKESLSAIEIISVTATIAFWGIGFGWVSRRFEWQADLFGAQCVTPPPAQCRMPCSVHPDKSSIVEKESRVCMTGATIFASALERVAILNGIPRDERSWRHSSIDHRIRRLFSLAGDPGRARRFSRTVRRLQQFLVTVAVTGLIATVCYLLIQRQPAILRLQTRIQQQAIARRAGPIDMEAESPLPCHGA